MLEIKEFSECDIEKLTPIMKKAFNHDAQIHLGKDDGPTGYDNGDFLRKWYLAKDAKSFVFYLDNVLIGGCALWINKNQINYLGNIFIDPTFEGQGVGSQIWEMIEKKYPTTKKWQTETPGFSIRNHYFYVNKLGFKIYKIENPRNWQDSCYHLEKEMKI